MAREGGRRRRRSAQIRVGAEDATDDGDSGFCADDGTGLDERPFDASGTFGRQSIRGGLAARTFLRV